MISQCEALLARFFTKECQSPLYPCTREHVTDKIAPPPNFDQDKEHVISWCIQDFIHILHRHRLELAPQDPLRLDMCLATASKCVDEIEFLAEQGPLPIMQDTGSCMTSALIVFLSKVCSIYHFLDPQTPRAHEQIFRNCSRIQKSLIVSLLQRILLSHSRVSEGDDDMATAYVARFTRRILGVVGQESRAGSPGLVAGGNGINTDDIDFMAELVSSTFSSASCLLI